MRTHSWDVLAELPVAVPDRVVATVERFAANRVAIEPVPAASVILVRDGRDGIETYLLHRHARMPFAASMVVFPGGRLDPVDLVAAGTGFTADGAGTAAGAGSCAVGEASPPARSADVGSAVSAPGDAALRRCGVRETLEETGVTLRPDDLVPWAHWVTPEPEPRRFDTYFYVAALPDGADAADLSGETDSAAWSTAREALAAGDRGDIGLMPPTRSILIELAAAGTVATLLAAGAERIIEPVIPRIEPAEHGWRFVYPRRER